MPSTHYQFAFHVPFAGSVDDGNCIIRGVSLITGDLEAEGHGLQVDDTTLDQILHWAGRHGKVTVKMDHKGPDGRTFKAIAGYLTNFTKDSSGKKVRGDLELLHSEPLTPKILEMARRMPENFGLSVAFKGKGERGQGGKQFARCTKLLSVDLVENPAANPDGLFSARVDTRLSGMPDPNSDPNGEPTLAELFDLLKAHGEKLDGFAQRLETAEQFQQSVINHLNVDGGEEGPTLEELHGMSDEELAELGISRAEVDAAVAEANGGDGGSAAGNGNGDAGAGGAAGGEGGGAFAEGRQALAEVRELKARMAGQARREEAAQMDYAFAVVEEKVETLAAANDELVKELGAKDAEIKALRLSLKTGARNVPASVEGVTLFSAKGAQSGSFEQIVTVKFEELKGKTGMTELKAKSQAIDFAIRSNPGAYREYRERGGKIELVSRS